MAKKENAKKPVSKKQKQKKEKTVKQSYIKGVKLEMSKVKWPTFKEITKYSVATLVLCVALAVFFEALGLLFVFIKGLF